MTLTFTGRFLLYFNRHADAPLVWNVAPADRAWEVAVRKIEVRVPLFSHYEATEPSKDDEERPSAYFFGDGTVRVDNGGLAVIEP